MKNEVINNLKVVANALNNINVCGKNNLLNLSGSISMIEETIKVLSDAEITSKQDVSGD